MNEIDREFARQAWVENDWDGHVDTQKLIQLVRADEREACAKLVGERAQTWWSIHCASNKHIETTRKAHDAFCALQAAIRARSSTHG
jgi:hypothetical protein